MFRHPDSRARLAEALGTGADRQVSSPPPARHIHTPLTYPPTYTTGAVLCGMRRVAAAEPASWRAKLRAVSAVFEAMGGLPGGIDCAG